MQALTFKQKILLTLFFGILALTLLAPIASNIYLPLSPDFGNHVAGIIQAKFAIAEHQFPIRTAPLQDHGWTNAYFQFYAPFPYTIGGAIYKWLTPETPFLAYKITIWLALLLSALYFYKLVVWIVQSRPVAMLAALVYMSAPYFLININTRGDFTEAFGQGLVPVVLYYTFKSYFEEFKMGRAICTAIAWFALMTTHVLVFSYTGLFVGLLLILFTLRKLSNWRNLIRVMIPCSYALLLAAWYLIPMVMVEKFLLMNGFLGDPYNDSVWLTPLSTLLSITGIAPIPLAPKIDPRLSSPLYPAISWPILLAVGICVYLLFQKDNVISPYKKWVYPLLVLFFLALLMVWSPIDFWQYLPKNGIIQFSYRVLTQTMWLGGLIFAFALVAIKPRWELLQVVIGIFLIFIAASSWLPTNKRGDTNLEKLQVNPDLGYGAHGYIVNQDYLPQNLFFGNSELPLIDGDDWLKIDKKVDIYRELLLNSPHAIVQLKGIVPPLFFKKAIKLTVQMNDLQFSKIIAPGSFEWNIPIGQLKDKSKIISLHFFVDKPYIPSKVNPTSHDNRSLAVKVSSLTLLHLSPESSLVPVESIEKNCARRGSRKICDVTTSEKARIAQLPLLYYPDLLDIKVNNKALPYFPTGYKSEFVLASLNLQPGTYKINLAFRGYWLANWLSGVAWIMLLSVVIRKIYQYGVLKWRRLKFIYRLFKEIAM